MQIGLTLLLFSLYQREPLYPQVGDGPSTIAPTDTSEQQGTVQDVSFEWPSRVPTVAVVTCWGEGPVEAASHFSVAGEDTTFTVAAVSIVDRRHRAVFVGEQLTWRAGASLPSAVLGMIIAVALDGSAKGPCTTGPYATTSWSTRTAHWCYRCSTNGR